MEMGGKRKGRERGRENGEKKKDGGKKGGRRERESTIPTDRPKRRKRTVIRTEKKSYWKTMMRDVIKLYNVEASGFFAENEKTRKKKREKMKSI